MAYGPTFIVAVLSLVYQIEQGTTTDVSWLITLSERLLDGQTAYIDFFEVNPPASILLYLPAVAMARVLHVAPEAAVKGFIYLVFALNAWLCRRVLRGSRADDVSGLPLALFAAVYLLLPGDVFAQREHFIVLFLLPILSVLVVRAEGRSPATMPAILAGIEAGAAIAIKPFFIAAVLLPLAYVLWRRRRAWRAWLRIVFAPEQVAVAAVAAAYGVAVVLYFPAFLTKAWPIAVDVYGLYTNSHLAFLHSWNAILWAGCAALAAWLAPRGSIAAAVGLIGSLGCVAAMMLQGRYFDYHAYPSIALALSTLALAVCRRWTDASGTGRRVSILPAALGATLTLMIFVRAMVWFAAPIRDDSLQAALSRLSSRPRIMSLSMGHGLAHPLVRNIGGTFVGRLNSPWMYFLIKRALREPSLSPEQRRRLHGYIDLEKDVIAEDIARERPDFVLVSRAFDTDAKIRTWPFIDENWMKSTPSLIAAFAGYHPVQTVGDVTIWARNAPEPGMPQTAGVRDGVRAERTPPRP